MKPRFTIFWDVHGAACFEAHGAEALNILTKELVEGRLLYIECRGYAILRQS